MTRSYAKRLFRLTLLAPLILSAILNGEQQPDLTARRLLNFLGTRSRGSVAQREGSHSLRDDGKPLD
jgi:hypothetical protein